MNRVAVVTGGTRGIGRAISVALKAADYKVAANYAGNDAAAREFTAETGIPALIINGDLNDLRLISDEQTKTNVEAFIEQLEEAKA